jgi:hypothetical protein
MAGWWMLATIERIIGLEGRYFVEGQAIWRLVDSQHPTNLPDASTVILERSNSCSGGASITLRSAITRPHCAASWNGASKTILSHSGSGDASWRDPRTARARNGLPEPVKSFASIECHKEVDDVFKASETSL